MTNETLRCPECGTEVWDVPEGHKLAKCWNTSGHASGGTLAFDTMDGCAEWDEPAPEEGDDYIADDRDGYRVTHDERHLGTYPTLSRAAAALYVARHKGNYWPKVWYVNDHGNMTLCVFDGHVLRQTDTAYV